MPDRRARAVSCSPTTIFASPRSPSPPSRRGTLTPAASRSATGPRRRRPRRPTGSVDRVIDHDVLERVLSTAMRSGGEFAEVYAEDKRSTSAGLDDGRVEQVTSGRDRGAGIRVVAGETTGFAHTSDLTERGPARRGRGRRGGRPPGRRRNPHRRPHAVGRRRRSTPSSATPTRSPRPTRSSCCAASTRPPAPPAPAIVQVSAGYGDSRKRVLVANSDGLLADDEVVRCLLRISAVADGDTGMQTGFQSMGHTDRLRDLRHRRRRGAGPRRRPPGDHQARGPPGAVGVDAGRHQARHRRRAVPRGVRPRPRGRPRRQGRQRVPGQDRRARRLAARHRRRRRHDGGRVGHAVDRRRGPRAPSATCSSRTAC